MEFFRRSTNLTRHINRKTIEILRMPKFGPREAGSG